MLSSATETSISASVIATELPAASALSKRVKSRLAFASMSRGDVIPYASAIWVVLTTEYTGLLTTLLKLHGANGCFLRFQPLVKASRKSPHTFISRSAKSQYTRPGGGVIVRRSKGLWTPLPPRFKTWV